MPLDFLFVGAQPMPGYECQQDMGGSVFYRLWKMRAPDGSTRMWKAIDLVVGNAAVETRNLEMLVKIRHPHLNTLTNYYTLAELKTLIIETDVPVKSLRERLNECKSLGLPGIPAPELLGFLNQAAEGLDFLNAPRHQFQGKQVAIYHRDLRPESLLLFREDGKTVCKVSDFGLAKPVTEQTAQHSQGLLHFDYDPPEFYEGVTAPTSDQYALAINYYELRCGTLPFQGTMLEQLSARLSDSPNLSGIDSAERHVVKKALSKEPGERFSGCKEFVARVAAAVEQGESEDPSRPVSPTPVPRSARPGGDYGVPPTPVGAGRGPGSGVGKLQVGGAFASSGASSGAGGAAVAESPVPGVTIRRPPVRPPSVKELEAETGENLQGIVRGAANRPASNPREFRPQVDSEIVPAPERAAAPPQFQFEEKKVPLVWVVLILLAVFSAIAVVAREFVMGRG
jgi:hypothetical protein